MDIHIRNVLWPTDFSTLSMKGAQYAQAICSAFGSRLHVINVVPVLVTADSSVPVATGGDLLVTEVDAIGPARRQLRELLNEQGRPGTEVDSEVVVGTAWTEICRYVTGHDIDLVVIATHGATGLKHVLMGSTAERVVRHAACPVLTVKSFEREFIS